MLPKTGIVIVGSGLVTASVVLFYIFYKKFRWNTDGKTSGNLTNNLQRSNIDIIEMDSQWSDIYMDIVNEIHSFKAIGFDCEWVSVGKKRHRVALLQLAFFSGRCVLVRLNKMEIIPPSLADVLSDKSILKVGVGCCEDGRKLETDYRLAVNGCLDLRHLAARLDKLQGGGGLQSLAANLLGIKLEKTNYVRCSNWECDKLTMRQVMYGAKDALVGLDIFLALLHVKFPSSQPESILWPSVRNICQGLIDTKYNQKSTRSTLKPQKSSKRLQTSVPNNSWEYSRRSTFYHNCEIRAPDGQLLWKTSKTKAQWYIKKKLGVIVREEPLAVSLTFEPYRRPPSQDDYVLEDRHDVCVVCGSTAELRKNYIIPKEYRKYFPLEVKEHSTHDIVLLCHKCHYRSKGPSRDFQERLAQMCSAPKVTKLNSADSDKVRVKGAANALLKNGSRIPVSRRIELEKVISTYFDVAVVDEKLLNDTIEMDVKNPDSIHGCCVVEYFKEHSSIQELAKLWRQHFLDAMKPQHMAKTWSVNHISKWPDRRIPDEDEKQTKTHEEQNTSGNNFDDTCEDDLSFQSDGDNADNLNDTQSEYQSLDFNIEHIDVIENSTAWEMVYPKLTEAVAVSRMLGIACEWEVGSDGNPGRVSLLQLATLTRNCVLIRLTKMEHVPSSLAEIMQDKSVIKVGVGCMEDGNRLCQDYGLIVRGCVDLRNFSERMGKHIHGSGSLQHLAQDIVGVTVNKSSELQHSKWETDNLTHSQIQYAAYDALVAVDIFMALVQKKVTVIDNSVDKDIWPKIFSLCQGLKDVTYQNSVSVPSDGNSANNLTKSKSNLTKKGTLHPGKANQMFYHNCRILAPDGQLLCKTSKVKALWYISRELAVRVDDEPLVVQLKFEPSRRPPTDDDYFLQDKESVCVVCGETDQLSRKYIVPREYRKYFPKEVKEHKIHDVVLMCSSCHLVTGWHDQKLKARLAAQCGAPATDSPTLDYEKQKVKAAAKALLTKSSQIPEDRLTELRDIVSGYHGIKHQMLDNQLIQDTAAIDIKKNDSLHGRQVVQYFEENKDLQEFERIWRQHFLDEINPKFLCKSWSVDHTSRWPSHTDVTCDDITCDDVACCDVKAEIHDDLEMANDVIAATTRTNINKDKDVL